ncbi:MAG TPA: cbb3-type cytochrome c oxidase N-terminal domain-containing protein [Chitinophaga sp.]
MRPTLLLPLLSADALHNPLGLVLTCLIVALGLIIILLAYVLNGAAEVYHENDKQREKAQSGTPPAASLLLLTAALPEAPQAAPVAHAFSGLSPFIYYTLVSVIAFEIIVVLVLLFLLRNLLRVEKVKQAMPVRTRQWKQVWFKLNRFKPMQEEASLDLGHDYDGIRELDNRLPGWWLYGFYACIVFAMVYLWRYHVSHSAPLSAEEYRLAVAEAEEAKAAYLAKAANQVDENTVKLLTDANDLAAGKKIFTTTCFACHAADGGGGVGPNLTDNYWLHGGDIQSVFKTIKYGWPDKGMKSWKDDYSPLQIAQIASYVKSLRGSKPAAPKEPQGTLTND